MFLLDRLLRLTDMGGRRRQRADRRKAVAGAEILNRRQIVNRRSGFDRRGILACTVREDQERRRAFRELPS